MRLTRHIIAAIPLSVGIYAATGSLHDSGVAGLTSVLIDVDHVPDYVYYRGSWGGVRDFFDACNSNRLVRTVLLFHSWEAAILLGILCIIGWHTPNLWPIAGGMVYHLALDSNANGVKPSFYWLSARAARGFRLAAFRSTEEDQTLVPGMWQRLISPLQTLRQFVDLVSDKTRLGFHVVPGILHRENAPSLSQRTQGSGIAEHGSKRHFRSDN